MSLHYWNTLKERTELKGICATTCVLYMFDTESECSSDSDSDVDEEDRPKDLPLLFTLATLSKYAEVHGALEDTTIQFGRRLVIDDFNDSQCIMHFRFRKEHLKVVARAL